MIAHQTDTREKEAAPDIAAEEQFSWDDILSVQTAPRQVSRSQVVTTELWSAPAPKSAPPDRTSSTSSVTPVAAPQPLGGRGRDGYPADTSGPRKTVGDSAAASGGAVRGTIRGVRARLAQWGLLDRFPEYSVDLREDRYFGLVQQAKERARRALADVYTDLVARYASVDMSEEPVLRERRGRYGFAGAAGVGLGRIQVARGNLGGAARLLRPAVRAEPHDSQAWRELGLVQLLARNDAAAERALAQAEELQAGDPVAGVALAVARYHQGRYDAAEETLRRHVGPGGRDLPARSFLCCSLRMQGKWTDARVALAPLRTGTRGWQLMAEQCLDCIDRGEETEAAGPAPRRRAFRPGRGLTGIGFALVALGLLAEYGHFFGRLFEEVGRLMFIVGPLLLVAEELRKRTASRSRRTGFGRSVPTVPCWQQTTWVRPQKPEVFGAKFALFGR